MAHWRDGGIGNMAGSDDRPIEEWTLLEKLADVATAPVGSTSRPYVMRPNNGDWATPLKALAQAAFDEIQRLRYAPVDAAIARTAADRNAIIKECIDALECELAAHEKSNEGQGILHAMNFLETLKSTENGGAA